MRRFVLAVTCSVMLALVSSGAVSPASAQQGVLSGTWTSVDIDGSSQQLRISGSGQGRYGTVLFDDSASQACGGAPARFVGSGSADGTTLQMTGTVVCLPGGNVLGSRITLSFVYSPTTDTLTDESGVVWYRS